MSKECSSCSSCTETYRVSSQLTWWFLKFNFSNSSINFWCKFFTQIFVFCHNLRKFTDPIFQSALYYGRRLHVTAIISGVDEIWISFSILHPSEFQMCASRDWSAIFILSSYGWNLSLCSYWWRKLQVYKVPELSLEWLLHYFKLRYFLKNGSNVIYICKVLEIRNVFD